MDWINVCMVYRDVLCYVRKEMKLKLEKLSQQLQALAADHFEQSKKKANDAIEDAISPFVRYVKVETDRVAELDAEFRRIRQDIRRIKAQL